MKKRTIVQAGLVILSAAFFIPTLWRMLRFVVMGYPVDGARVLAGIMFGCILLVSTGFASIIKD